MKNFHQNLLICLALALCGLCAFQWCSQTVQRNEIGDLNHMVFQKNSVIQDDTNSIASLTRQMEEQDIHLTEIKTQLATNEQFMAAQKAEITRLQFANTGLTNEITQYKAAVDTLKTKLKDTYLGVEKQNETITNLVGQRDNLVKQYNDEVKDRNDIVAKYNALAAQVQKQQSSSDGQK
jgi:chromosome segregation ATPase